MTAVVVPIGAAAGRRRRAAAAALAATADMSDDLHALSAEQIRAARSKLGMTRDEFTSWLSTVVGWSVYPGVLERWEQGHACPPGDVLLASQKAAV